MGTVNATHQAAVITKETCMAVCKLMPNGLTNTNARQARNGTQLPM